MRAFNNQIAFELRHGAEHVQHELAGRAARVEPILDGAEVNASGLEIGQQLAEMRDAAADAIHFPASQRVAFLTGGEDLGQHRPVVAAARCLLDEDIIALDAEGLGRVDRLWHPSGQKRDGHRSDGVRSSLHRCPRSLPQLATAMRASPLRDTWHRGPSRSGSQG